MDDFIFLHYSILFAAILFLIASCFLYFYLIKLAKYSLLSLRTTFSGLLFCILCVVSFQSQAQYIDPGNVGEYYNYRDSLYCNDTVLGESLDLEALGSAQWSSCNSFNQTIVRGFSVENNWFYFDIGSTTIKRDSRWLEFDYTLIDYVDVYHVFNNELIDKFHLGDMQKFESRVIEYRTFIAPINLVPNSRVYFRIKSSSAIRFTPVMMTPENIIKRIQTNMLVNGVFFGVSFLIILACLLFYFKGFKKILLYYSLFCLCLILHMASFRGFSSQFLWRNAVDFAQLAPPLFMILSFFWASLYTREYFTIKSTNLILYWTFILFEVISLIFIACFCLFDYRVVIQEALIFTGTWCVFNLLVGLIFCIIKQGIKFRLAVIYVLAWSGIYLNFLNLLIGSFVSVSDQDLLSLYSIKAALVLQFFVFACVLVRGNRHKTIDF